MRFAEEMKKILQTVFDPILEAAENNPVHLREVGDGLQAGTDNGEAVNHEDGKIFLAGSI